MAKETIVHTNATHSPAPAGDSNILAPELQMVVLTWVLFFTLLAILKKFAWKPILKALDDREAAIRTSVEEAAKTKEEYLRIDEKRKQILSAADEQAKEIINLGREAAVKNAKIIEEKTKQQAQIIMENAQRELAAEEEKAAALLREKSANAAVKLAEKILRENLDAEKHKKVNTSLIDEI